MSLSITLIICGGIVVYIVLEHMFFKMLFFWIRG